MGIRLDRRRVLCQYKGPFFKTVRYSPFRTSDTNIGSEFISSVHYSKDGHVYMGSKFGGLSSFDIRTKEVIWDYCHLPQLFPSITSIQSDSRNIYAAVRDNIVIINKRQEKLPTHCGQSTAVIFSGWISTSSTVCGSRHMPDWSVSKRATVYGKHDDLYQPDSRSL